MADAPLLKLNDLCVSTAGADSQNELLLQEISLTVGQGETHLLVGQAGVGKSVLAKTALGSPQYAVERGTIRFQDDDITSWPTDVRAKAGLFLCSPGGASLNGVTVLGLLQAAASSKGGDALGLSELHQQLTTTVESLGLPTSLLRREVSSLTTPEATVGLEVLQLLTLAPKLVIIDLPADAITEASIELLAAGLQRSRVERPGIGTLIMSRYDRLLDHLEPDNIHVLRSGRIAASDFSELAAN